MRRVLVGLAGVMALLVASSCAVQGPAPIEIRPSHLQTAAIATVSKPIPIPKPKFTRTMYVATQLAGAAAMLDACHGPIAVELGVGRPVLVAQHNYCGGDAWIPKLNVGDGVKLTGDGIYPGIYVVTEIRLQTRNEATVGDLPIAGAVLQTCLTTHKLILVGLDWVGAVAS